MNFYLGGKMKKLYLLLMLIFFVCSGYIKAQEDTTKTDDSWKWHWKWEDWKDWEDWKVDFGFKDRQPAITVQYGLVKVDRKDLQSKFVDPGLIELKLGHIKDKSAWGSEYIINHNYKYLYISNETDKLSNKESAGIEIKTNMWRFGFGSSSGYGYKLGESASIIPYNSNTINWSRIEFTKPNILSIDPLFVNNPDDQVLDLYNKSFRFGTSSEGGIRIKMLNNIMLDAGYEKSIIFQRHLFWKWAGSAVIEAAGQGLLDSFIHQIFRTSPAAGPIVNFVLKNALAYGIYELRKDKMNWPFNSEPPFVYDQFKFGLTFVF
jgi:hypothetical protein